MQIEKFVIWNCSCSSSTFRCVVASPTLSRAVIRSLVGYDKNSRTLRLANCHCFNRKLLRGKQDCSGFDEHLVASFKVWMLNSDLTTSSLVQGRNHYHAKHAQLTKSPLKQNSPVIELVEVAMTTSAAAAWADVLCCEAAVVSGALVVVGGAEFVVVCKHTSMIQWYKSSTGHDRDILLLMQIKSWYILYLSNKVYVKI